MGKIILMPIILMGAYRCTLTWGDFVMEEGADNSEFSQVREVYEAIQATKRISLKL